MKRMAYLLAVTCAGVGLMGPLGCNKDENKKAGDAAGNAVQNTGNAASNAADKLAGAVARTGSADNKGVRNLLAKLTDNAVSKDSLNNVVDTFSSADRDRLKGLDKTDADLNTAIDAFRKAWKDKYGKDFKPGDVNTVYNGDFAAMTPMAMAATGDKTSAAAEKNNRKMETVSIKDSHGMSAVEVPVVSESGLWKINVPDSLDAQTLKTNLTKTIQHLNADTASWPADINDGYRAVSHAVALAVMNKPVG
ncbi:MAG TPA: hypothetical protein VFC78_13760 [Tepidisphaeraceae bacterium]|nr:hypothetical protein [Tepidisphaeraceae bacterium]